MHSEDQWLSCQTPSLLLYHLAGHPSERKPRLFGVACCQRIWHLLTDERDRQAVELVERHADGNATRQEFISARLLVHRQYRDQPGKPHERGCWVVDLCLGRG